MIMKVSVLRGVVGNVELVDPFYGLLHRVKLLELFEDLDLNHLMCAFARQSSSYLLLVIQVQEAVGRVVEAIYERFLLC